MASWVVAVQTQPDSLRLAGTVIRLVRALDRHLAVAVDSGLSMTDITVMGSIERGVTLASQLARSLELDPPKVTRVVERLVECGYVERGADSSDRRRSPLAITPNGRAIVEDARTALSEAMTSILERLPSESRTQLVDTLEEVRLVLGG